MEKRKDQQNLWGSASDYNKLLKVMTAASLLPPKVQILLSNSNHEPYRERNSIYLNRSVEHKPKAQLNEGKLERVL